MATKVGIYGMTKGMDICLLLVCGAVNIFMAV